MFYNIKNIKTKNFIIFRTGYKLSCQISKSDIWQSLIVEIFFDYFGFNDIT